MNKGKNITVYCDYGLRVTRKVGSERPNFDFGKVDVSEVAGMIEQMKNEREYTAHGWDVCPMANRGCEFAKDDFNFEGICSKNYVSCTEYNWGDKQ